MTQTMPARSRVRRGLPLAMAVLVGLGALVGCRPIPETGLYSSQQHTDADLTTVTGQIYGTATNVSGNTVQLGLDLYLPPAGGPATRPTVVLIHGGGFATGNRGQMATAARTYARRGFVAVSISYRLDPGASAADPARFLAAALNGIDDGMESIRWLRANAATYRIDPTRIAMVGSSAGGAIALGVGAIDDPTPGGPLAAFSPKIAAAVSTGAHLTPGVELGVITFQATDAPGLMFHHVTDTVTGNSSAYARQTCDGLRDAGTACVFVEQPGSGHTTSINAGGTWWTSQIGPFLWNHLRLHPA